MYKCDYCKKSFKKEGTLAVHMCEQKRRHMNQYDKDIQLGYRCYQLFYKFSTNSKKDKTYQEFAKSQYFSAFVKFAGYCIDLKVDDVESYTKYLIKAGIRLDKWATDRNFNTYIKQRLKEESVDRAIERTVMYLQEWAERNAEVWNRYFDKINTNVAVAHICSGKISPWVLYSSDKAQNLIDRMNEEQINMVSEYIDPKFWSIRVKRKIEDYEWAKRIMKEAGL